ncbi:MAG: hypothetical protein IJV96_00315 [Clostridia bacterium]|nr:hypothetical protein [Clostridia bacterium]
MSVVSAVGVSLLCAVCALVLRESKSPVAPLLSLLGGLCLLLVLFPRLGDLFSTLKNTLGALDGAGVESVGKILSAALLVGVGCDACTELGAPHLAAKLDFFGKIEILLLALPTLDELLSRVTALLS